MATRVFFNPPSDAVSLLGRLSFFNMLRTLAVLFGFSLCTISARAQLQQPFVFAVDSSGPISRLAWRSHSRQQLRLLSQLFRR
jgi:hypothetical protein